MNRHLWLALACVVALFSLEAQARPSAVELIEQAATNASLKDLLHEGKVTVIRPRGNLQFSVKLWSKSHDFHMLLVTAPARNKGMAWLRRKGDAWMYAPSIKRVIRLRARELNEPWLRSDFSHADAVGGVSLVRDFKPSLLGQETVEGKACYKLELTPKKSKQAAWGKVVTWISAKERLHVKQAFYDKTHRLVKTLKASKFRVIGGQLMPTELEMSSAQHKGHKTVVTYSGDRSAAGLKETFFTIENMKRVR